jgi:GH35 family endo-1,4-beta-xylanase
MVVIIGIGSSISAPTYDYSHRKSKCSFKVPAGASVKATLIRNHFGFGGSIRRWAFDTLQIRTRDSIKITYDSLNSKYDTVKVWTVNGVTQNYDEVFPKYFDIATPENEMKWAYVQGDTIHTPPSFAKADYIVDYLKKNDIKLRGHNLFWNEKKDWIPKWTLKLSTTDFKAAMKERIDSAMTHFNGKTAQWDVINEIVHAADGQTPSKTMLDSASGDPNIFSWILEEARKIDKTSEFVINDYNMETESATLDKFITKCTPLKAKFDVIGMEGHFQSSVFTRSDLETKINKLATQLGKKVWLTEVDWLYPIAQSPAKMEELMRTCFANKNVDGIVVWVWCQRKMWRDKITSYFVDSLMVESAAGKKWRDVRAEWKTDTSGSAGADGVFSFTGYQGKYRVIVNNNDTQYVYLYPKDSTAIIKVSTNPNRPALIQNVTNAGSIRIQGQIVHLPNLIKADQALYLSTYSISGKLLSEISLTMKNGLVTIAKMPSGCNVYRIHSKDQTYYSGIGLQLK